MRGHRQNKGKYRHPNTCKYLRTRTLTFYLAPYSLILSNWDTRKLIDIPCMDLIHTHWTLTIRPWTVLYPSKCGPVLNMFLCYLQSPGHNRKTRMVLIWKCVLVSLVIYTHTHPHFQVFTNAHTHTKRTGKFGKILVKRTNMG